MALEVAQPLWDPQRATTLLASTACYRDSFTFLLLLKIAWKGKNTIYII
jgi:hypothetical protein